MPVPEVRGECPPHYGKWGADGIFVWKRRCDYCGNTQTSSTGPILYGTHLCHRALGKTFLVVWWPNNRFEETNYMGPSVKFCPDCNGRGCKKCNNTGTVG